MTSQERRVVVNLDLDEDVFSGVVSFLKTRSEFSNAIHGFEDLGRSADDIELVALYLRRADGSGPSIAKAVSAIEATARQLEQIQIRHAVKRITLVDCGEVPTAPLSDFSAVALYLETFAGEMSPEATARVFALDHDFAANPAYARLYDTQSAEFLEHFVDHTKTGLQMLNTGFGSGKLPPG